MSELATQEKSVTALAAEIISAHNEFMESMEDSMKKAIKAGELLLSAKERTEHGGFQAWIETNLPFSIRTAQNYMKIAKKQDVIEQKGAKMLSTAYDAVKDNPSEKNHTTKVREYDNAIDDDSMPGDDEEEKEWDNQVLYPDDFETEEADLSYVAIVQKAATSLRWAYRQLANNRNSTTPRAFGFFVGNLIEMAERIETWKPENMEPCPECSGTGIMAMYDANGDIEHTTCPFCLNGKVGKYKETER